MGALWQFDGPVADVIEYTKYRGDLWRIQCLKGEIQRWFDLQGGSIEGSVTAVPVAPSGKRLRKRGFDLPTILARWMASQRSIVLGRGVLRRISEGQHQATLDRAARLRSVRHTFESRKSPCRVVLIDDVITTGATVSVCAEALVRAGAEQITVLALARTPLSLA